MLKLIETCQSQNPMVHFAKVPETGKRQTFVSTIISSFLTNVRNERIACSLQKKSNYPAKKHQLEFHSDFLYFRTVYTTHVRVIFGSVQLRQIFSVKEN